MTDRSRLSGLMAEPGEKDIVIFEDPGAHYPALGEKNAVRADLPNLTEKLFSRWGGLLKLLARGPER
jgi:hypothetical protein